jgi:DNA-binding Lrp family transcriptional regulator
MNNRKSDVKEANADLGLDLLDVGIIRELQRNSRTSYRQMARSFGVSVTTVSERVNRLVKVGLIRGFTIIVNPEKAGPVFCAALYIKTSNGRDPKEVGRKVSKIKGICYTYQALGLYDIIALGSAVSKEDFSAMIRNVTAVEGIKEVIPSMVIDTIKEEPRHPIGIPEK